MKLTLNLTIALSLFFVAMICGVTAKSGKASSKAVVISRLPDYGEDGKKKLLYYSDFGFAYQSDEYMNKKGDMLSALKKDWDCSFLFGEKVEPIVEDAAVYEATYETVEITASPITPSSNEVESAKTAAKTKMTLTESMWRIEDVGTGAVY